MAGKKRTRKAAAAAPKGKAKRTTASSPGAAGSKSKHAPPAPELPSSSPLFLLLQELRKLALDTSLCQEILMTLVDGTAPVLVLQPGTGEAAVAAAAEMLSTAPEETKATPKGKKKKRARANTTAAASSPTATTARGDIVNPVAQGGFWMILATHVLNRLLAALDTCDDDDHSKENISQVLAVLSYFLARILLPVQQQTSRAASSSSHLHSTHDKTMHKLLEKACGHAKAKSLLGRAILSITVSCTTALDHLAAANDSQRSVLSMACWVPATLALDMAVRLSHSCPKVYASISGGSTPTTGAVGTPTAATTSPVTSSPATATTALATTGAVASPTSPSGPASPLSTANVPGTSQCAVTFWNESQAQLEDMAMHGIMIDSSSSNNNKINAMTDDKSNHGRMETVCQELCQTVLDMAQWEVPCLVALLGIVSGDTDAVQEEEEQEEPDEDASPPAKRAAGRRKSSRGATTTGATSETKASAQGASGSAAHPLLDAFHDLVSEDDDMKGKNNTTDGSELRKINSFRMDGRVAAKRWSSMALVWLLQGQRRVLEAMVGMLLQRVSWQESTRDNYSMDDDSDKKRPAKTTLLRKDTVVISGNVVLMALVTRLAGIVNETHAQSGSRAPSGGLDAYVRAILPGYQATEEADTGTKATGAKKVSAKKPQKVAIPDLRDVVTVALYHLLQAHEDCLEMNFKERDGGKLAIRLVNDEDHSIVRATDTASSNQLGGFNPVMRPVVESLCRAASATASSTGTSSNYAERSQGQEHLRSITSSFVLQNIQQGAMPSSSNAEPAARQERPLDAQLVQFALAQFSSCLEKSDSNSHSLADDPDRMTDVDDYDVGIISNRYELFEPLPIPVLGQPLVAHAAAARRGTKSTAAIPQQPAGLCTYAGMVVSSDGVSVKEPKRDYFLTLFVRSAIASEAPRDQKKKPISRKNRKPTKRGKGPGDDTDTPECATKLLLTLLSIMERSYDGLVENSKPDAPIKPARSDTATKRTAPASKGKGSKRRKTNDGAADESGRIAETTRSQRRPLNVHRATLAEKSITLLNRMVSTAAIDGSKSSSYYDMLRRFIKMSFAEEHILQLIGLTNILDDLVIAPRTAKFLNKNLSAGLEEYTEPPDVPDFAWFERSLWLSNLCLCTTIGRKGLRTNEMRLSVFHRISTHGNGTKHWPLWLPPALRALVSMDVASQTSRASETEPEQLIANGYVSEISAQLNNWEAFPQANRFASGDMDTVDYELPLSLQDARLFLVAAGRLKPAERMKLLSRLQSSVRISLATLLQTDSFQESVRNNRELSSFIARIVTLCSWSTLLVVYPDLNERLRSQVKQGCLLELPGFVSECDWYRSERCYMGVFSDWESPRVPLSESGESIALKSSLAVDFSWVLGQALALGFHSAKGDRGHLLFASWNALGNRPLWEPQPSSEQPSGHVWDCLLDELQNMEENNEVGITTVLTYIRDDMCRLYSDMHAGHARSLSSASKLTQSKDRNSITATEIKKSLKSVVANGERLLTTLLECEDTSPELFTSLEATANYISFGIASHTKPSDDDAFSMSRVSTDHGKRPRGDSLDSERDHSDLDSMDYDSDDDPASRIRERLQAACADFGAAPTHPDWLDDNCSLLFGVTPGEAIAVANTAVRALTNLISMCRARQNSCLQNALKNLQRDQERGDAAGNDTILARKVYLLASRCGMDLQHAGSLLSTEVNDGYQIAEQLAALFNLEANALEHYMSGREAENLDETKTAWCPNSAQRILGRYQELSKENESPWLSGPSDSACSGPELRVDRQWEVLLGTSLAAACRNILQAPDNDDSNIESAKEEFLLAEYWFGVAETAVSALVPAAALLRFGLSKGGRKTHPLALDLDHGGKDENRDLPVAINAPKQQRDLINECLGVLARFSAQCSGELPSSLSCRAAALQLVNRGECFDDLRALEAMRFVLTTFSELSDVRGSKGALVRQCAQVLEYWIYAEKGGANFERFTGLLSNGKGSSMIDTMTETIPATSLLAFLDSKRPPSDLLTTHEKNWRWGAAHEKPIATLAALVGQDRHDLDLLTRTFLSRVLNQLCEKEIEDTKISPGKSFAITTILKVFNSMPECVEALLSEVSTLEDLPDFQKETCRLLAFLVTDPSWAQAVVDSLVKKASQWLGLKSTEARNSVLDLLTLFSFSNNSLARVGSIFLEDTGEGTQVENFLESTNRFLTFIKCIAQKDTAETIGDSISDSVSRSSLNNHESTQQPPPRACSYSMKRGFHGQHWYNCYTCGLTWDKGCCTLCALVCHAGHDVGYCRFSSFFCDCGAEDGGEGGDGNHALCKCLAPVHKRKVQELFEKEGWPLENGSSLAEVIKKKQTFYLTIAKLCLSKTAPGSVSTLIASVEAKGWRSEKLFGVLRRNFESWSKEEEGKEDSVVDLSLRDFDLAECHRYEYLRQALRKRIGQTLSITNMTGTGIVPLRATSSNTFHVKYSGNTGERLKRSKNDLCRGAIVADSRGRLVIAEPCSLLFCSAASSINIKHAEETQVPFSRSAMSIMGSSSVRFNIVGMKLCAQYDRHLVIWGTSEASVLILKDTHDGIDRQINFSLDMDATESDGDYVIKCQWIPGSQTCVLVGCGTQLNLFDISRAGGDDRAIPIVSFGLGFDSNLRDMAVVPAHSPAPLQTTPFGSPTVANVFLMLENGRLYCVELEYDNEGKLSGQLGSQSAEIGVSGAHSLKTLGEGSSISYLAQSNIILYECSASCVLALTLGGSGKIDGSFELLPHTIEMLGIGGPYTHWVELGESVDGKGEPCFRAACVGRSFRTNQPKLLCVEFNGSNTTRVQEVARETETHGVGANLYSSFEGLCALSLPGRVEDAANPDASDGSCFAEIAYICGVTSNGSLLLYRDENCLSVTKANPAHTAFSKNSDDADTTEDCDQPQPFVPSRSFFNCAPITLFERLKNMSENCPDEVVFGGDGLPSDSKDITRKLSRDSSVFLMSPRREGCTLTVSLGPNSHNMAMMAVRFLVGSTSLECIPKFVSVQGRPVEVIANTKKWYSIALRDEEIAVTVRTRVLAIGMGQTFDGTQSPVLDSFEVYALERRLAIQTWLPTEICLPATSLEDDRSLEKRSALLMACASLESICDILGPAKSLTTTESDLLKLVVQGSIVKHDRLLEEKIDSLLSRLYPSTQARNSIRDEGALQGCSLLLAKTQDLMSGVEASSFDITWFTIRTIVGSVLKTSSQIARIRPINYLKASDVLAENKTSSGSIAVDASRIIKEGIERSLPCADLCETFVELALAESAIGDRKGAPNLASYNHILFLLNCKHPEIVERSCRVISSFCRSDGKGDSRSKDLFKGLDAARLVCYQCDSCSAVPMTSLRYSLLDDHDIDLCRSCWELGNSFARSNNFDTNTMVVVEGKTLALSCALIKEMQPVPILAKADVTEVVEVEAESTAVGKEVDDKNGQPQNALEGFVNGIFSSTLKLLSNALQVHGEEARLALLLSLLTDLVRHSSEQSGKLVRAKMFAAAISEGVSSSIVSSNRAERTQLLMCLRSLTILLAPDTDSSSAQRLPDEGSCKPKQVMCDVHGVPAVKRRCARGEHKDRRFWVCGLERALRCKFFVWTDQVGQTVNKKVKKTKSPYEKDLASSIWNIFNSPAEGGGRGALQVELCQLLEGIMEGWRSGTGPLVLTSDDGGKEEDFRKLTLCDSKLLKAQYSDGVFCSHEKLHNFSAVKIVKASQSHTSIASRAASILMAEGESNKLVVEATLELLGLIGETDGISRWFSILCAFIGSPNKNSSLRSLAKRVLKKLCTEKNLYHSVRDHYVFGFQIKNICQETQSLLRSCLLVKEKARQSGPFWKTTSLVRWKDTAAGSFLGTELLLSEDCVPLQSELTIGRVLDDLWNVAKNRNHNWRRFCGHVSEVEVGTPDTLLGDFLVPAPLVLLLWVACSTVAHQEKALLLVDLALAGSKRKASELAAAVTDHMNPDHTETHSPDDLLLRGGSFDSGDLHGFILHFAYMGRTSEIRRVAASIGSKLLSKLKPLEAGSILVQLLRSRRTREAGLQGGNCVDFLNLVHSSLAKAQVLPHDVQDTAVVVFDYFKRQFEAVKHNEANEEWVYVDAASGSTRKKYELANCIHCHGNSPGKDPSGNAKGSDSRTGVDRAATQSVADGESKSRTPQTSARRDWLPGQVSPYTRIRLDGNKETTTNDAFCSYRQLKHRVVLSEFFVNLSDPRGRFVKTINLFYTARPVEDVTVLKSDSFLGKWQLCATVNIARGASRASCSLSVPVVAANLKIQYAEFYGPSSKNADGSFLVHCPRCTRVVQNAHGVCGNCGEVAFQCRKCRHINYDQLQSFLCVECGFCSAGSFSFDMLAGTASSAVSIKNDDDYARFVRMVNTAERLNADLLEALREKLRAVMYLRKTAKAQHQGDTGSNDSIASNLFATLPGLRRAFYEQDIQPADNSPGPSSAITLATDLLVERAGKKGWAVKMIAAPGPLTASTSLAPTGASAADRTRSLLQLARQLRTEGASENRRRTTGDVVIRGRGGATAIVEGMEEDTDLLTLLENAGSSALGLSGLSGVTASSAAGGAGLVLDQTTDPLSRLLTSFQTSRASASQARASAQGTAAAAGSSQTGRARNRSSGRLNDSSPAAGANATSTGNRKQQNDAIKKGLEECDKLYLLMKESQREAYQLKLRMDAWKRLERDELADRGGFLRGNTSAQQSNPERLCAATFTPSHCSSCSNQVAVQLLLVWLRLFQADPAAVTVTRETVELLLDETHYFVTPSSSTGHGSNNVHRSPSVRDATLLLEWKRHAVREIATKAPIDTSRLVLNQLSKRLRATREVASAEILGSIISEGGGEGAVDFELAPEYVDLAMEVLHHESLF